MKSEKVEKLVVNSHDKKQYVIHTRNLKETLSHRSVLEESHRVIKSTEETSLKPYLDKITELKKMQQMILKKIFSG